MDRYEREMFNFLTIEENLKGLIIAKEQFNNVRKGLIKNFWDKVYNSLKEHFLDSTRWEVKMDSNIFDSYSKLYLQDRELVTQPSKHPSLFFCWERLSSSYPYYGICTNVDSKQFDLKRVFDFLKSQKTTQLSGFQTSEKWPLWDGDTQFDFNRDSTLLQIIPSKVEEKAKEYSSLLIDLFDNVFESYEIILRDFRL